MITQAELDKFKQSINTDNLSNLTDKELNDLLDQIKNYSSDQTYSDISNEQKNNNLNNLSNIFSRVGFDSNTSNNIANDLINSDIPQLYGNSYDNWKKFANILSKYGLSNTDITVTLNKLQDLNMGNDLSKFRFNLDRPNFTTESDLINSILTKRGKDTSVANAINSLPSDLAAQREDYLSRLSDYATHNYNENVVPGVMNNANVRGALFSGDVPDALSAQAINIQKELDSARSDLESQDNALYFNAAYQNKLKDLANSNTDYQSALANERANILTRQSQDFQTAQTNLLNKFNENLYAQDAERQLRVQEANYKKQQRLADKQNTASTFGQIGQIGGTLAGAYLGGPTGAMIGSQIGSGTGQTIGKSIG